jgi:hypothetical protein
VRSQQFEVLSMTKRISELPAAGAIADTDELELNQSGLSRKATRGQIVAGLASAHHQHDLADITDAGALAALDAVGTADIDAGAYASAPEAVAGIDNARIMTALRTAEAIAAQAAATEHQHGLADITDAGALAALDAIRPTEIDPSAYATQVNAVEGLDGTRIMTAARTAEAIAARAAPPQHQHDLGNITDAGALAGRDTVGPGEIDAAAYASQSEAVAGTNNAKIMTPLRTAQAIAAQPPGAPHQHTLADITDAGALAALDAVGTAEIKPVAYASQSDALAGADETKIMTPLRTAEAVAAQAAPLHHQHELADIAATAFASESEALAGTDNAKIMTPLRTAQAIAAQPAGQEHQHPLADIIDAGALAGIDTVGTAQIDADAYASASEAVAGTDSAKIMTALRTAEAIAALAPSDHQHDLADITDAGALAALNRIGTGEIDAGAYASQPEAIAGTENSKIMTALRTAEAIVALAPQHLHHLEDITDAGALAYLDAVSAGEILPNAVTTGKILNGAVSTDKLANLAVNASKIGTDAVTSTKIAADAVTEAKIADGAVTAAKIANGAVGAGKLQPGIPIDMQDALLKSPELREYSETSPTPAISSGTLSLDFESGNAFQVVLTQNVTSLQLLNPPAAGRVGSCSLILRQDGTGGRTLAWPVSVKWAGGVVPTITTAAHGVDVFGLITRDGGATWYGFPAGQNFS